MGGLDDFNSEDFDVHVPEFSLSSPSLREARRICPEERLIARAAMAAYYGNHYAAEKLRKQAGYLGISDHEFPS